jgi:hypothetical protein
MCHPCAAPRDVHQSNSGTISGCANLKFDGAKVMAIHCCPLGLTGSLDTANGWQYSRPLGSRAVELGTVRGFDVGLPIHFHDEDQITFVLSGSRRFIIGNELVKVGPGEGTYTPQAFLTAHLRKTVSFSASTFTQRQEGAVRAT